MKSVGGASEDSAALEHGGAVCSSPVKTVVTHLVIAGRGAPLLLLCGAHTIDPVQLAVSLRQWGISDHLV